MVRREIHLFHLEFGFLLFNYVWSDGRTEETDGHNLVPFLSQSFNRTPFHVWSSTWGLINYFHALIFCLFTHLIPSANVPLFFCSKKYFLYISFIFCQPAIFQSYSIPQIPYPIHYSSYSIFKILFLPTILINCF